MSRTRLPAAERRAQILAAAREVFVEQGVHGTKSRMIADRAGITEAYLYRHFHSKEEIYQLAIAEPLRHLIERMQSEVHELAEQEVSRADVALRCNEIMLECMVDIAPMLAASLFSAPEAGRELYRSYLWPNLAAVIESIMPDMTGWPIETMKVDVFVGALLGVHLGVAFEQLLDDVPIDVPVVAAQITRMFAPGLPRNRSEPIRPNRPLRVVPTDVAEL